MINNEINITNQYDKIIPNLMKELELYEEVLRLTYEQEKAIKADNIEKLSLLISEKDNYIRSIKKILKHNENIKKLIMQRPKDFTKDKGAYSLIKQIQSKINNALNNNRSNIKSLSSLMDKLRTKSVNLSKNRKAISSLRMQQFQTPRFIDVLR